MNDITALAQRMKAAADRAKDRFNPNVIVDTRDVLALVEALEKAQAKNKMHKRAEFTFMNALGLVDGATRDDILPAINAIKYLLNNANEKIASLESRTVTLPEVRITIAESKRRGMTNRELNAHNAGVLEGLEIVSKTLAAAGIQVIEGEGQCGGNCE